MKYQHILLLFTALVSCLTVAARGSTFELNEHPDLLQKEKPTPLNRRDSVSLRDQGFPIIHSGGFLVQANDSSFLLEELVVSAYHIDSRLSIF